MALSSVQRRSLRARAHPLDAVVAIGDSGLSAAVMHEIDLSLKAHELIKVKAGHADHAGRDAMMDRICQVLGAEPVQHIGKILVIYREQKDKPRTTPRRPAERGPRRPKRSHQGHSAR